MSQNTAQPVEEPVRNVDTEIQMMLSAVARLKGRWGIKATAGVLCRSEANKLMEAQLDEMSVYGLLEDLSQSKVVGMLEVLVRAGLIRRNDKSCLELTLVGKVLEAVKKVSRRHSPADLSGFFALKPRYILRIYLLLIALKPNKSSRRVSVRFF